MMTPDPEKDAQVSDTKTDNAAKVPKQGHYREEEEKEPKMGEFF